jgi:hypothetical protein
MGSELTRELGIDMKEEKDFNTNKIINNILRIKSTVRNKKSVYTRDELMNSILASDEENFQAKVPLKKKMN